MYRNSLNKLYNLSLFNSNKDGLKNMIKINSILNNPLQNIPIIHIAGTNGKVFFFLSIYFFLSYQFLREVYLLS